MRWGVCKLLCHVCVYIYVCVGVCVSTQVSPVCAVALFVLTECSQQGATTTTDTASSPLAQERLRAAMEACRPSPAAVAALPTSVVQYLHSLSLPFLRTTALLRNAMLGTLSRLRLHPRVLTPGALG